MEKTCQYMKPNDAFLEKCTSHESGGAESSYIGHMSEIFDQNLLPSRRERIATHYFNIRRNEMEERDTMEIRLSLWGFYSVQ